MRFNRRDFLLGTVAVAGLPLTPIGRAAAQTQAPGTTPKRGGDLIYLDAERTTSFQLTGSSFWQTSAVINHLLDRLVFKDPDTLELKPWIASSWSIDPTGTVYDFVIRRGVTYSDGTALDLASVKRNLEWQANGEKEKGIPRNSWFPQIASVTTDDARHAVTVTLTKPNAPFLHTLTSVKAGLVSNATIDASRETQAIVTNLIGSGPFVAKSEIPGKETVLVRRKGYAWAPATAKNQGEAYVDSITIIPVEEDSVRLGALKSGQGHALRYVQPSEEKALVKAGYQVVGVRSPGTVNFLEVRFGAPFVDDINVRRAILHGIDRQEVITKLYTDNWKVATSVLAPGTLGYKDLSAKFAFDAAKSNGFLDAAGWTERGTDGIRRKDGKKLEINIYVDVYDNTSKQLYQLIQWQLKNIGLQLNIKETDYSSYPTVSSDPSVGLRRNGWPSEDPYTLTVSYLSTLSDRFRLKGEDKKLEQLLADHVTAVDPERRAELLGELQDYLIDNVYAIPLLEDSQVFVLRPNVRGFGQTRSYPWFYSTWLDA
ncbi:ABC transporter substrate-binding protein [Ancylobacter sp. Lp-2]|uniref:ABC transporter substrate-binding protein n=1 Tax=Ancylobacter sp. Lp-2 TaxID=2881339 RepID=UPI001E3ECB60|nr:ABC transporter substrate-binding protein [Ancylobacter sp. Lp-2]MCB4770435.1 ABC transporter substrate-binding protein [Ancylobacter sp. Lp-2]